MGVMPQALKSAFETILAQLPMRLYSRNSKDVMMSSNGLKKYTFVTDCLASTKMMGST